MNELIINYLLIFFALLLNEMTFLHTVYVNIQYTLSFAFLNFLLHIDATHHVIHNTQRGVS